jgi:mRNA interferase HigB
VRVISPKRIKEASAEHSEWSASLKTWLRIAKTAKWKNSAELKQSWSNFEKVGICYVFDIMHNRCRLIAHIDFRFQLVFVRSILSHAEYGKDGWKDDCDRD